MVATNSPITDFQMQIKQVAWRSFVVVLKVAKGSVPPGMYWDTEDPYHYVRQHPIAGNEKEEFLIVGGEDHRTGEKNDAEDRFLRLEEWVKRTFSVHASQPPAKLFMDRLTGILSQFLNKNHAWTRDID